MVSLLNNPCSLELLPKRNARPLAADADTVITEHPGHFKSLPRRSSRVTSWRGTLATRLHSSSWKW